MADIEAEVFEQGKWRNFDDLEQCLTLSELLLLLSKHRELQFNEQRFLASLKGIDLGGATNEQLDVMEDSESASMFGYTQE